MAINLDYMDIYEPYTKMSEIVSCQVERSKCDDLRDMPGELLVKVHCQDGYLLLVKLPEDYWEVRTYTKPPEKKK